MHGRVPRKICQEVLDELTEEKFLTEKEYGKAKIYLANQDKFPEVSKDELGGLDSQINELRLDLDEKTNRLKDQKAQLAEVTRQMTNEQLINDIARLKASNLEKENILKEYNDGGKEMVTEEEIQSVKQDYLKYQKHWRVRRRACLEIVDMISDSVDMRRKDFMDKLGLETDEEYALNLNDFPNTVNL